MEEGCSGELLEREGEDRFSRTVKEEKRNGRAEKNSFIDEIVRELCGWNETDGIAQDYWNILRLHKEEQVTVVEYEGGYHIFKGKIDLCIGGSPCQSFSFAGTQKGMITKCNIEITTLEQYLDLKNKDFEFQGQSFLFWEYVRLLKEVKPKYFMLENVRMSEKWRNIISEIIGFEPIYINSNLVSIQNRPRLYWTNIPDLQLPVDEKLSFQDIKEDAPLRKVGNWVFKKWGDKIRLNQLKTLNTNKLNCLTTSKIHSFMYYTNEDKTMYRNLTLNEAKIAQTIPNSYDISIVPEGKAFHMIGNGWTVEVIKHIFKNIK